MNYVASNSLYLTARFAHVNGPFSLTPKGGLDKQVFVDADGVYHNTNSVPRHEPSAEDGRSWTAAGSAAVTR